MRVLLLVVVAALGLGTGCREYLTQQVVKAVEEGDAPAAAPDPAPEAAPPGRRPQSALPSDPTLPMNTAKIDEAKVRVDLAGARAGVREYRVLHGRNPPNLKALDLRLRFAADLHYDPGTGHVRSKTYPQY